jgi:hypothetical protein
MVKRGGDNRIKPAFQHAFFIVFIPLVPMQHFSARTSYLMPVPSPLIVLVQTVPFPHNFPEVVSTAGGIFHSGKRRPLYFTFQPFASHRRFHPISR